MSFNKVSRTAILFQFNELFSFHVRLVKFSCYYQDDLIKESQGWMFISSLIFYYRSGCKGLCEK